MRYGMNWHAFWRANVAFRGYRLFVITPITTITLMHWRTAYALLLPNMANRICSPLSYHGIPQRYADEGDHHPQRCRTTTRELASALGMAPEKVMMTFQSRFGREPWLMPYTDETLKMLGEKGVGHIQVMCPGCACGLSGDAGRDCRAKP
ncbi:ferrochelatase [Escherichia coli]